MVWYLLLTAPYTPQPTPPLSPPKTTVQDSVPPPPVSQPASTIASPPLVTSPPIIAASIPAPILTKDPFVNVNTFDVGAKTEEPPKVTTEPISPTLSADSSPVLGGDEFEFDSTYYSPYQIPIEEDESTPATKQQIDSVHEKLDTLIDSTKKYNDVVLKAFMDATLHQYTESIDKCTVTMDDSTSMCKRATSEDKDLRDSQVFLDFFKGHADSNAAKVTESIEMKGFSERIVPLQQGGEEEKPQPIPLKPKVKTEPKDNLALGSGIKEKKRHVIGENDESDEDQETLSEILKRKKRDAEIDETLRVAKEAEERGKEKKEEDDALCCKKMLFLRLTKETLIKEAIESPSTLWLEPMTSFDCDNTRNSQFDMPITRKAFIFHCFYSTVEVSSPHPQLDCELIDFYLTFGQPQYLTWSAQKIITVKVLKPSPARNFIIVSFKIARGSDNSVSVISLEHLPNLNPHDWIFLFNILLTNSKEYGPILEHLKRMIACYMQEVSKMDQEVANFLRKKPTVKPTAKPGDVNKMTLGQIDSTHLTVMFTSFKGENFLFALVDKHLFSTDYLEHIINIIHRCKANSESDKKNFKDMLKWYITFRQTLLAIIPGVFKTVTKSVIAQLN
ncbi:hypothetical protein Lser_V15G41169 [Lactuca serriola]